MNRESETKITETVYSTSENVISRGSANINQEGKDKDCLVRVLEI